LQSLSFTNSEVYPNLYLLQVGKSILILVLYVNDIFLIGNEELISKCKKDLDLKFQDEIHWFDELLYGIRGVQHPGEIFLGQGKYAVEILNRFIMMHYKSMSTPMTTNLRIMGASYSDLVDPTMYKKLIRSFIYLVKTRPDIFFAINTLS
jgi:hypothetical protein